jgi:hypothetical protein
MKFLEKAGSWILIIIASFIVISVGMIILDALV